MLFNDNSARQWLREFYFKGIYHVYDKGGIEEYTSTFFEYCLPGADVGESIENEVGNCDFDRCLLALKEVEENKQDEFYFEIVGKGHVEYDYRDTYDGPDCSADVDIDDYEIVFIPYEVARKYIECNEEDIEDVMKEIYKETGGMFRD